MLRVYPSAHCSQKLPLYCGGQLQSSTLNAFSGEAKTLVLEDNKEEQTTIMATERFSHKRERFESCGYTYRWYFMCQSIRGQTIVLFPRHMPRAAGPLRGKFQTNTHLIGWFIAGHKNPKRKSRQLTGSLPLAGLGWVEQLIQRKLDVSKNAARRIDLLFVWREIENNVWRKNKKYCGIFKKGLWKET